MLQSHLSILPTSATMCGDEVYNPQGEKIGKIIDFRIDLKNRRIAYAVLSFSDFTGDKLFALPWEALHLDTEALSFVLDVVKEVLQNAPCVDPGDWQSQSDRDFINRVYTHYGYDPYYDETGRLRQHTYTKTATYSHQATSS